MMKNTLGSGNGEEEAERGGKEMKRSLTQSIERRKRISEKSSDRLNLIKGQYRSFKYPSFNNLDTPASTPTDPNPLSPFLFVDRHRRDETPRSAMSRFDLSSLNYSIHEEDNEAETTNTTTSPTMEESSISNPSPTTRTRSHNASSVSTNLTQKQMHSCIQSSKKTRALSSLIIAILVVLSHIFNPLSKHTLSSHIITALRPIYTVLLTDVTILLTQSLLEKERVLEEPPGEDDLAGSVGFQAVQGLVMDCAIYLVFAVCGLYLL